MADIMGHKTGQGDKLRSSLCSMWNGQPTSLLDVVCLDWQFRKDLGKVILTFGFEDCGVRSSCRTPR